MKITAIKPQAKARDRYSIFIDDKYAFSLSESALLEAKLSPGQELQKGQVREFKQASADDKIYQKTLKYVSLRPRSKWEVEFYLIYKKRASPALTTTILNKLSNNGIIDDAKFAKSFVNDRFLLKPTSLRKLRLELQKKHIDQAIIDEVLKGKTDALIINDVILSKRRQSKYQDNQKLMQYLARQGYSYGDIKDALSKDI